MEVNELLEEIADKIQQDNPNVVQSAITKFAKIASLNSYEQLRAVLKTQPSPCNASKQLQQLGSMVKIQHKLERKYRSRYTSWNERDHIFLKRAEIRRKLHQAYMEMGELCKVCRKCLFHDFRKDFGLPPTWVGDYYCEDLDTFIILPAKERDPLQEANKARERLELFTQIINSMEQEDDRTNTGITPGEGTGSDVGSLQTVSQADRQRDRGFQHRRDRQCDQIAC